jgi:tetratricopeptide (TPR) repeat protein
LIFPETEGRQAVPKPVLRHVVRGGEFYRSGQFEAALAECLKALALLPDSPVILNNLGDTLYHLERYEEAIKAFEDALRLRPEFAEAYVGRGVALERLSRYEEALKAFEKAIDLRPNYFDAHFNRWLTLRRMGLLEDADAAIKSGLAVLPDADLATWGREAGDEILRRLRRKGIISWGGGKPSGAHPRVRLKDGPPLSDYIIESRR